jgi:hypothetical protein
MDHFCICKQLRTWLQCEMSLWTSCVVLYLKNSSCAFKIFFIFLDDWKSPRFKGFVAWLIRRVFDWMIRFITSYTFTALNYRQYSAMPDLHTLHFTVTHAPVFSVFTSRILATDLSQSNFKSHMKSSHHSLIPFLPFLLNDLRLPYSELKPVLDNSWLKWTLLQLNSQLLTTDSSELNPSL